LSRILLVEDEAVTRLHLTQFLTDEGHFVIPVATGEEALKILQTEKFDAVIADYKLGSAVNGAQVLAYFERISPGSGKVLLTAYPAQEIAESPQGALHISKPLQIDDLLIKLKSILP
jgi:DNA-binding NtrC family response regulator